MLQRGHGVKGVEKSMNIGWVTGEWRGMRVAQDATNLKYAPVWRGGELACRYGWANENEVKT